MRITDRYTRMESSFGDSSHANEGVSDSDSRPAVAVISEKSGTDRPLRSTLGSELLAEFRH